MTQSRQRLNAATSEQEATTYLAGLNLSTPQLRQLAADLDVRLIGRTKQGIIADIVRVIVSGRLMREAIQQS